MTGRTIEELALGDTAEVTHAVTVETIQAFVDASGDDNPIHSDPAFAAATRFGRVIAPGMLTGSFISSVIGTRLPGPGTVYVSQSLRFLRPVYVGDRVTVRVAVAERLAEKNRIRLATTCRNQDGELLLEGEAWVVPSRERIEYHGPAPVAAPGRGVSGEVLALTPAALAVKMMAFWMTGGFAFADQVLRLSTGVWCLAPRSQTPSGRSRLERAGLPAAFFSA